MRKINKVNKFNNERGITLIILIITIIIILILSGATISLVTEKYGLINKTKSARGETEFKNIEQIINRSYKYLQEESDNAFEEAIKELKEEGYTIKVTNEEDNIIKTYYVLIGKKYYKLIIQNDEIKVDRTY